MSTERAESFVKSFVVGFKEPWHLKWHRLVVFAGFTAKIATCGTITVWAERTLLRQSKTRRKEKLNICSGSFV